MTERRDTGARHPLFHAMVLMGGSLALHCGGNVRHDPAGSAGNVTGGSADSAGTGGAPAGGGNGAGGSLASGGLGAGGAIVIPLGGSPSAITPGPFDCPPAQWDCSATPPSCWGEPYMLPDHCACDPARPKTAADCVDSDWVCRRAEFDSQQRRFTSSVNFECTCAPHQSSCNLACQAAYDYPSRCAEQVEGTNAVLCNCAVIVLR